MKDLRVANSLGDERGVALLIVTIISILLVLLGLSLTFDSMTETTISSEIENRNRAFLNTDAGYNSYKDNLRGLSLTAILTATTTVPQYINYTIPTDPTALAYFNRNPLAPLEAMNVDFDNPPTPVGTRTINGLMTPAAGVYHIVMTQGGVEFLGGIDGEERELLLSALKLHENDLDSHCPIQHVSTGNSKIIVGIKSRAKLNSLMPDLNLLMRIDQTISNKGYFLFTFDSDHPNVLTHARMFAPQIGINEDPVTGNGNGPLGAYVIENKLLKHNGELFQFKSQQGEAIGRAGIAHVSVEIEKDRPTKIRVGGDAVIAFEAEIEV